LYADFIFADGDLKNTPKTSYRPAKNYEKFEYFCLTPFSRFLAHNYLEAFFKAVINKFEISINFCVFFIPS